MNFLYRSAAIVCTLLLANAVSAQTASGTSTTSCSQTGSVLTCTTTTTVALPSAVNLQAGTGLTQFALAGGGPVGPACTGLTATPSTVAAGGGTAVALAVACPTGSYTYAWASPLAATITTASTTYTPNLSANNTSAPFSVTVCFTANAAACSTYTTTVTVIPPIAALSGCTVTPTAPSIVIGGTATLTAACTLGTGAGANATYNWTRNGAAVAGVNGGATYVIPASETATAGGPFTYSVAIANNVPSAATATAAVTVTGPVAQDMCPTIPVRGTINASSPSTRIISSNVVNSYGDGAYFPIQINVAAGDTTSGRQLALLSFSDAGINAGGRFVTISKTKCDFSATATWLTAYFLGTAYPQNGGAKVVSVNEAGAGGAINLTTGTWYLNVQNAPGSCSPGQSCHFVMEWGN
jgi:hypothetical protein